MGIGEEGGKLFSRRVANDEPELVQLLADTLALGDEMVWTVDLADGGAALAITLWLDHGQPVLYIAGRTVNRASEAYLGEAKTDARDATIIYDQARTRHVVSPMRPTESISAELKPLTARSTDLVCDRTHSINRLLAQLAGSSPLWNEHWI